MRNLTTLVSLVCFALAAQTGCGDETNPADDAPTAGNDAGGGGAGVGSGGGGETDPGTGGNGGGGDGGSVPEGKVAVFVAQGSLGHTTISCDDGHTWVGDHSWDVDGDPMVCGSTEPGLCYETTCSYMIGDQCEQRQCCNDTPDVAKGVVYGDGQFVATWGWGAPGEIRRSTNGIDWVTTHPADSFGGIAYGGGRFVAASRFPVYSSDGTAWTAGETADFLNDDGSSMWSVRRFAYADFEGGGRFVAVASGNTNRDMLVSSDGGQTWWRPSVLPDNCANNVSQYGGIVAANDIILIVGQEGEACRSIDGGDTWSVTPTGATQILSHGVWTGSEFQFWGDDSLMLSSPDGATWTQTPMVTPTRLGPVARSPEGTLVATSNVWQGYDELTFLRSTDGLTWEQLPAGSFVPSHSIFYITFGYADPSAECPVP